MLAIANKKEANMFRKDFLELMKVAYSLNHVYASDKGDASEDIKRFKKIINDFNKKYKGIKLKLQKSTASILPMILITSEKSVKEVYSNAISKLHGIFAIGSSNSSLANISSQEAFFKELDEIKNILYVQFKADSIAPSMMLIEFNKKEKAVQVNHSLESIANEESPEYQVILHYALKEGVNSSIDIHSQLLKFSFIDISEMAMRHFLEKFSPLIEE